MDEKPIVEIRHTSLPGVLETHLVDNRDERGGLMELIGPGLIRALRSRGVTAFVAQAISAETLPAWSLRGIHGEPWSKLIMPLCGKIFVVLVELRPWNDFGAFRTWELTRGHGLYVPAGVGNSYLVLQGPVHYVYLVEKLYVHKRYPAVAWNGGPWAFEWPSPPPGQSYLISPKDSGNPTIDQFQAEFPDAYRPYYSKRGRAWRATRNFVYSRLVR